MKVACKLLPKPVYISWCNEPVKVVRTLVKDNPGVSKRNLLALCMCAGVAMNTALKELHK